MDLKTPGDRQSPCGSRMMPIGLTLKNIRENPFTGRVSGELMIVHACLGCNKVSANRIAGDDNSYQILQLFDNSKKLSSNFTTRLLKKVLNYSQRKTERLCKQLCLVIGKTCTIAQCPRSPLIKSKI